MYVFYIDLFQALYYVIFEIKSCLTCLIEREKKNNRISNVGANERQLQIRGRYVRKKSELNCL